MKERIFRTRAFAKRCTLELVRDPLSYVFSLGFPLVMLIVMTLVNNSIPPEAGMTVFRADNLAPAVYVFGLSFLMLFTALLVSKDRAEAFLVRLYISPMRRADFLLGYTVPILVLAFAQGLITMAAAFVVGIFTDVPLDPWGLLLVLPVSVPAALLFVGFGLLFGALFSDKAAPPLSSAIISVSSFLGGMWMDLEHMGGVLVKICDALPFRHAVDAGRKALAMDFGGIGIHLAAVLAWAAVIYALAVLSFRKKV